MISRTFSAKPSRSHAVPVQEAINLGEQFGVRVHVPHDGAHIPCAQGLYGALRAMSFQDTEGAMPPPKTLAERLDARLRELNLSARAASLRAGLGDTAIKAILNGRSKKPAHETLLRIAAALDMSIAELTGDTTVSRNPDDSPVRIGDKPAPRVPVSNVRAAPHAPVSFGTVPQTVPIYAASEGRPGVYDLNIGDAIGLAPRHSGLQSMGREVWAFFAQGTEMAPWRQPGELVYATSDRPPQDGNHVVVMLEPGAAGGSPAILRRLVRQTPRELVLEQHNPPHKETVIPRSQVRRVYRVIEWQEMLGV